MPDKITGWSHCTLHGQAAYDAWAEVTAGIDAARLPFLVDLASPARPGGEDGGGDQGDDGPGKPAKRGGRRTPVECACHPQPRRLQLTPKQIEDGPIICGLRCAPFELPEDDQIASLTQARDDLGARAERTETDLDTARAQLAHPAAPSQAATGTA